MDRLFNLPLQQGHLLVRRAGFAQFKGSEYSGLALVDGGYAGYGRAAIDSDGVALDSL
jgi:hypothetical protein